MAGNLTDYAENTTLDTLLTGKYVGLFTTDPGEASGGTEVSGGSYARQALSANAASGGSAASSADITFPVASAEWGEIKYIVVHDASSAGHQIWHLPANLTKLIQAGDQYVIPAGDLVFSLD